MLTAIYQSVFKPHSLVDNQRAYDFVRRYGWVFIVVRWLYYSVLFQFRDYHGRWSPFWPPPFGLDMAAYANLQRSLALPFGIVLMLALSIGLAAYLGIIKKKVSVATTLNILGMTFFLPFVLVQPVDQVVIALVGWKLIPVTAIHTVLVLWESWAAIEVISSVNELKVPERVVGTVILSVVWILIAGSLWR